MWRLAFHARIQSYLSNFQWCFRVLTTQHIQEDLSAAYAVAVGARAGVNTHFSRRDYGVDGSFNEVISRNGRRVESGFAVDFQLKASKLWDLKEGKIAYDLEAKTYNDLVARETRATPLVLILLCLPENESDWLDISTNQLIMKRCCFWSRLDGEPTENRASKRIFIPQEQLLTPEAVKQLIESVRTGDL